MYRLFFAVAIVTAISLTAGAPPVNFAALVDEYYQAAFKANPNFATEAGIHDFDDRLPDMSAEAFARRAKELQGFQEVLNLMRKGKLSPSDAIDAEILDHAIRAELLENETIQTWKRNPVMYLSAPTGGIDNIMKRTFAPADERLRSVIGRLKGVPALMEAMKKNISDPPKEFADLALIVAKGSVGFCKDTLPAWAKTAAGGDASLLAEFEKANSTALARFEAAQSWIEQEVVPNAKGSYAIGADAFTKKLQYEEMLDIPLDKLLAIGEANLAKDKAAFIATAKKINPNKSPAEVLLELTLNHPSPDDLVPATRGTLERIRKFLVDKHVITIPSEVRPTVLETPPFQRVGGFASMDTPGAYETKATEAFYYVTPPEKEWDNKRKFEHMAQFNVAGMEVISIHETYPGHYMQFLYAKQFPTKVRKLFTCGTNVEGWAHYCEQMMLEEGYSDGDPKMQLAQLSEALLRDCRYVVGIKLHTQGMTVAEGQKYFMEQGFVEGETAFQEARRGTYNPTYLYYTLGKLQIYKLREDYKKQKGDAFRLETFHNDFVKQGGVPIKIMRKILLGDNAGPSL